MVGAGSSALTDKFMELLAVAISGNSVLTAVIWLVIGALIYFVADWGIKKIGLPEPFNKIAVVLLVLLVVVILVNALLTLIEKPFISF